MHEWTYWYLFALWIQNTPDQSIAVISNFANVFRITIIIIIIIIFQTENQKIKIRRIGHFLHWKSNGKEYERLLTNNGRVLHNLIDSIISSIKLININGINIFNIPIMTDDNQCTSFI